MSAFLSRVLQLSLCVVLVGACEPGGADPTGTESDRLLSGPLTVPPTGGFGDPGTTTTIDASGNVNWVGGAWYVPLALQAGDIIGSISVVVRDNGASNGHTSDGNNVIALLVSRTATGDTTRGFASSNGSGLRQTLTFTPTNGSYTVQAGDEMLLETVGLKGGATPGPSTVPSMTGLTTVSPPPVSITIPIPLFGPVSNAVIPGRFLTPGVSTGVYGVPIGSTIIKIAARVKDNTNGTTGPSTLSLALVDEVDDGTASLDVSNTHSTGTGAFQTIIMGGLSRPVLSLHSIQAGVFYTTGVNTAPGSVTAMEVTYLPAAN